MVYNTSVDVPLQHWTSADTLFYPIIIDEEPNFRHPIRIHQDYQVRLCIRYDLGVPLTRVPAHLFLQQMDTIHGEMRIKHLLMHHHITPSMKDDQGKALGDGWGSLYEYQETLSDLSIRFDHPGCYRLLIIPAFKGVPEGIDGIASIGIELFE